MHWRNPPNHIHSMWHTLIYKYNILYVTGHVKTGHICINNTCLENGTFLDHCVRQTCCVNFICFPLDLSAQHKNFSNPVYKLESWISKVRQNLCADTPYFVAPISYSTMQKKLTKYSRLVHEISRRAQACKVITNLSVRVLPHPLNANFIIAR